MYIATQCSPGSFDGSVLTIISRCRASPDGGGGRVSQLNVVGYITHQTVYVSSIHLSCFSLRSKIVDDVPVAVHFYNAVEFSVDDGSDCTLQSLCKLEHQTEIR